MKFDHILIRFGEISTKGRNRRKFVDRLKQNIKVVLPEYTNLEYEGTRDRLYIHLHGEDHEGIVNKLQHIFGIQSFSLAIKCESDLSKIKESALEAVKGLYKPNDTFKVTAKRANKQFPLDTNELNYQIGSHILINTEGLTVDVKNPTINVRVEVRSEATFITCFDYKGAGGLPVGSSGKGMLLLSGGIDSPVAGYLSLKRGVELEIIHFFSPPYTSERAKQKVIDLTRELTAFGGKINLHIVPFTAIQEKIQQQVPENYTMTSTRRMMLKIADKLREKKQALALITGESLGQVASQTLESMVAINDVTNTPIIRPLITMDKTEIIAISKNIGTHDISIRPYEDCCTIFTPASPKTKPKLEKVSRFESFVDFEELINDAIENIESIEVSQEQKDEFSSLF
ncbi:tRNA uracil 4-sulfurtransferase ThiI [Metabacillus sediminilitoris]|uniref:Probable tRNA sulfurtransferase n=1 Tax=Metabacillus sediminilitoris TaxID=2567941 RepID=A0A4S4C2P5_9BACI|nr:tRNA uracil 4-sulfurtransferase ThiI [Metabacillus sediminilitoris]QGQ47529.1 tRNA 4-thiouridine(8) synthase ThiI [Metabacillus sediminilitoris]THF81963.1 tRNA 4-thiouridine(8) synthase ThiI [Metabacillus sediminilitoris]